VRRRAGAAAEALLDSGFMTSDVTTSPPVPIRWGVLGTGFIAHAQTADLLGCGFTVVAVGSRSQGTADAFAAEFGIPVAHGSYEALVADPGVDAIYISTPHPFHAENALLALRAGKHVLIEKPFTLTAGQAVEVVDAGEEAGLVVMEAMWTRTLIADHNQDLPKDPLHRLNNPALGGGALLDLGIYPVSFAFDLFGSPTVVKAMAAKTVTGVDRQTAILFGFDDGRQAVLHSALDTRGPNTAVILGTEGRIEVDAVWYSPTTFTVFDAKGEVIERFDTAVAHRGMQFQAWEFERRIREGDHSPAILPARESVRIMETLDAVRAQIGLSYPGE
jgi:predicted dehydrogenase